MSTTLSALFLSVPVIIYHIYMIWLQTYVLRLDVVVHGIALAFVLLQDLLGLFAATSFYASQFA